MKLECYAVYDKAVGAFMPPFYAKARGEALRLFMDAVGDRNSPFCKHPADYTLFYCGVFDDGSGTFSSEDAVKVLTAMEVQSLDDNVTDLKRA